MLADLDHVPLSRIGKDFGSRTRVCHADIPIRWTRSNSLNFSFYATSTAPKSHNRLPLPVKLLFAPSALPKLYSARNIQIDVSSAFRAHSDRLPQTMIDRPILPGVTANPASAPSPANHRQKQKRAGVLIGLLRPFDACAAGKSCPNRARFQPTAL